MVQNRVKTQGKTVPRKNNVFPREIKGFYKWNAPERRYNEAQIEGGVENYV